MKLEKIQEALHVSDKYQVKPIVDLGFDSVHASKIARLSRKDIKNPRILYLKNYEEMEDIGPDFESDNLITDKYQFGKIAGIIEYTAFKIYKYLGLPIPKSVNIHFDFENDKHQLLVSSYKNTKTFGDLKGDKNKRDIYDNIFNNSVRNKVLLLTLFVGNNDFHGGNVATKFKGMKLTDHYFFDLELCFRNIKKTEPTFVVYLEKADELPMKEKRRQMNIIKNIDMREINHIIDISMEHAKSVIKKSIPTGNRFKGSIVRKWNGIIDEVAVKIKGNLKANKKYLLERYPV